MNLRRLALLIGILGFTIGILELATPGVTTIPTDHRARFVLGAILLFVTIFIAESIWGTPYQQAQTHNPEVRQPATVPGDTLEHAVEYFLDTDRYYRGPRVKEGIRAAAIEAITRTSGKSRTEAEQTVDTGTWTDNSTATAFLTDTEQTLRPVTRWLLSVILPETTYRHAVTQTINEILQITNQPTHDHPPHRRQRIRRWEKRARYQTADHKSPQSPATELGTRLTNHWVGITVLIVMCFGVGLLTGHPGIFLGGLVGIGYLAYAHALPVTTTNVSCTREISTSNPTPGDEIEITLTVTNNESIPLLDVRVIDGVPDALEVSNGSPRRGTPIAPHSSISLRYTLTARRGTHTFGPVHIITKNPSNSMEHDHFVETESHVTCIPPVEPLGVPVPLRQQTTHITGQVGTETGGDGIEFYATRNYRSSDEPHRINWRKFAQTRDLVTLEYRQERTANVVLAIDTQPSAFVTHTPYADHAVDRSVDAALQVYDQLSTDDHLVGIATFGPTEYWIPPANGTAHQDQVHEALGTDPVFSSRASTEPSPESWSVTRFSRQLPIDCQVIVFSPVCTTATAASIRHLEAVGTPVSVISPNPTRTNSSSQQLARMFRSFQLSDLRTAGIPVIDWAATESLASAILKHMNHRHR